MTRDEFTVRQKILLAAATLARGAETFAVEDLIVRAWEKFPESFSLRGHETRHPDSNRVHAKLAGDDGLCGLGWLEHTDARTYRITLRGRAVVEQLRALAATSLPTSSPRPATVVSPVRPPSATAKPPRAPAARPAPLVQREPRRPDPPPRAGLLDADVATAVALARCQALQKFLRGSPATFEDARFFWGLWQHTDRLQDRLDEVGRVLERAVESHASSGGPDPRLPPLATCYGLLSLHRAMRSRFARELDVIAAAARRESDPPEGASPPRRIR